MLLVSLVVVLREVLEASVTLALLFVLGRQVGLGRHWVPAGLALGAALAGLLAGNFEQIAAWQDGVGQELLNSVLSVLVFLGLACLCQWQGNPARRQHMMVVMTAVFTMTTTREGAELLLYYSAFSADPYSLRTALLGGAMGVGIGLSLGVVCYYTLIQLSRTVRQHCTRLWLALFGAGILSQGVQMLQQADWLPAQPALWDSGWLIPEHELAGQLLYALFSYEATPSALQLVVWLAGMTLLWLLPMRRWRSA